MKYSTKLICYLLVLLSFQGCSFVHILQIRNSTDLVWEIQYELDDSNGVFVDEVYIFKKRRKKGKTNQFDGQTIQFKLNPKEVANIGLGVNTWYGFYKDRKEPSSVVWKDDFLNVKTIHISSNEKSYQLETDNLFHVLSKNSIRKARIEIGKLSEIDAIQNTEQQ